jgi:hypothetical protein
MSRKSNAPKVMAGLPNANVDAGDDLPPEVKADFDANPGNDEPGNAQPQVANSKPQNANRILRLTVRTLTGQIIPVEISVAPDMVLNVIDIKKRIELTQAIPVSFQRLVFAGKELLDDDNLNEVGIKDGVSMHLFLRTNNNNNNNAGDNAGQPANQAAFNVPLTPIMAMADPRLQPPMMPMGANLGDPNANLNNMNMNMNVNVNVNVGPSPVAGGPAVVSIAVAGPMGAGDLSQADIAKLKEAHRMSQIVRMFAIIDSIFLVIWAIGYPVFFILLLLAVGGYVGAHYFKRWLVILYIIYLFSNIALRIWWITQPAINSNAVLVVILCISILIELFIMQQTFKFTKLVWKLTAQEIQIILLWRAMGQAND